MARERLCQAGVCLVTNRALVPAGFALPEIVRAALIGGVRCVQFRDLELPTHAAVPLAREIVALCQQMDALCVINGRPDLVTSLDAAGLHVGRGWTDDVAATVAQARAMLPPGMLIGASVHSVAEARAVAASGADYLIVGTIYPTASKPNLKEAAGPELIRDVRAALGAAMPLLAIGGITAANLAPVRAAGADGVCVMRAILSAADPTTAAAALLRAWDRAGARGRGVF